MGYEYRLLESYKNKSVLWNSNFCPIRAKVKNNDLDIFFFFKCWHLVEVLFFLFLFIFSQQHGTRYKFLYIE